MFESSLAKEMTAYLELRKLSVAKSTILQDERVLTMLDKYLQENNYSGHKLTEEILEA